MYKYCYSNKGAIYAKGLWSLLALLHDLRALLVPARVPVIRNSRKKKQKSELNYCFFSHLPLTFYFNLLFVEFVIWYKMALDNKKRIFGRICFHVQKFDLSGNTSNLWLVEK